jgi:hypothetical protein
MTRIGSCFLLCTGYTRDSLRPEPRRMDSSGEFVPDTPLCDEWSKPPASGIAVGQGSINRTRAARSAKGCARRYPDSAPCQLGSSRQALAFPAVVEDVFPVRLRRGPGVVPMGSDPHGNHTGVSPCPHRCLIRPSPQGHGATMELQLSCYEQFTWLHQVPFFSGGSSACRNLLCQEQTPRMNRKTVEKHGTAPFACLGFVWVEVLDGPQPINSDYSEGNHG